MSENKVLGAASGEARYRTPQEEAPPLGVKLLVYTSGGVTVVSDWRDDSNFLAWAPLPKKPARQCPSCGGFCGPRGCERENDKPSAWKRVPTEPTPAMLGAMQESALVSFDAAIEAELNDGPAAESLHKVVYRAMLAAAPEAPSAEPYCYIYEYDVGSVVHREFHPHEYNGRKPSRTVPLYATPPEAPSAEPCPYVRSSAEGTHWCALNGPPDHREVMKQALDSLSKFHRSTGWGDDCLRAVNALRKALGETE